VQRFALLVFAVVCGCALLAATPAPSILGTPVLIVYPFSVNGGDVSREAGSRLAVTIASRIADLGGVGVRPAPAGIDRQQYLDSAHHEGADYYITGFVTPLGDGVSVVEQLVSTQTGIVVYSNTAQLRTYADAASQGDVLRDALLRHQTRNLGAYAAPPPPLNTPTPQPTSGAAQANLSRLFGRKQRTAATPTPAASAALAIATAAASPAAAFAPSAVPTAKTVAALPPGLDYGVLAIGGTAADELRAFTGAAIRNDIIASHRRATQLAGTPQTKRRPSPRSNCWPTTARATSCTARPLPTMRAAIGRRR